MPLPERSSPAGFQRASNLLQAISSIPSASCHGKGGYVYYLPPGGGPLVRVTTEAMGWEADSWPNGVVGTPDGNKLYVNKWYYDNKGGTWVFDINLDGTLSDMLKFSEWGGDGMSMDELGNCLYQQRRGRDGFRS